MNHDFLVRELKRRSLKTGEEFTLASGQKSNVYVDVKKTIMIGYASDIITEMLYKATVTAKFGRYRVAAGVALGGCHLASLVGKECCIDTIHIRKEAKDHGTQSLIEGPDLPAGSRAVLFEDVVTTGGSSLKAAEILEAAGIEVAGIVAVVDRRVNQTDQIGKYPFVSLVKFEELIREDNAKESK
jgi:orotate phosphoribosyltransferase